MQIFYTHNSFENKFTSSHYAQEWGKNTEMKMTDEFIKPKFWS